MNKATRPLLRPYHVWLADFQEDRCCSKEQIFKEAVISAIPHVLINLLLLGYLIFGAILMSSVDAKIASRSFWDQVLFIFTTITTIGYGDISPDSFDGKLAILLYSSLGIPIILLVLSTNGKFILDVYNIICIAYDTNSVKASELPVHVSVSLLATHILLGGVIFSFWIDSMSFINAVYFCFVSISTIGFGDLTPTPSTELEFLVVLGYLSTGIMILSTLTGALSNWVRWVHNKGRRVNNSKLTEVWFGGKCLTVKDLVVMVSDQFQCPPEKLRNVLKDLDGILEYACNRTGEVKEEEEEEVKLCKGLESAPRIWDEDSSICSHTLPCDTELAINTLATISHQLKKASLRHSHHYHSVPRPTAARAVCATQISETSIDVRSHNSLAAYLEAVSRVSSS